MTVDEVARVLRLDSTEQVYRLMKRGLPYIEGVARGRLVLDEHLWKWIRLQSRAIEQPDNESQVE
jgi:hypothetical protein